MNSKRNVRFMFHSVPSSDNNVLFMSRCAKRFKIQFGTPALWLTSCYLNWTMLTISQVKSSEHYIHFK